MIISDESNQTWMSDYNKILGNIREASRSENTQIAYRKSWNCFSNWCQINGIKPIEAEAEDIIRFLITMAKNGPSGKKRLALNTLKLYRSGLNHYWQKLGSPSPANEKIVSEVMQGLSRILVDNPRRVKALREHQIIKILDLCGESLHGLRDAALLSLGFSAALRRSEICQLRFEDIERKSNTGIALNLRRSKTDQHGEGQSIAVIQGQFVKAITHLDQWLVAASIKEGYVFQTLERGGKASGRPLDNGDVARIVKRYVKKIDLDPSEYSGHSLRSGFVTCAATHHARIDKIMEVTRHKSTATLMKYIRDENLFNDHAGSSFL